MSAFIPGGTLADGHPQRHAPAHWRNGPAHTPVGLELSSVLALPSWPEELFPQQSAPPPSIRAQLWASPAARAVTPARSPLPPTAATATGVELLVVLPLPSWPEEL